MGTIAPKARKLNADSILIVIFIVISQFVVVGFRNSLDLRLAGWNFADFLWHMVALSHRLPIGRVALQRLRTTVDWTSWVNVKVVDVVPGEVASSGAGSR